MCKTQFKVSAQKFAQAAEMKFCTTQKDNDVVFLAIDSKRCKSRGQLLLLLSARAISCQVRSQLGSNANQPVVGESGDERLAIDVGR
jgi:hypothetical protein